VFSFFGVVMNEKKAKHAAPLSNRDFDFFYEGLELRQLLVQRCSSCQALRTPPGPFCLSCGSADWKPVALKGGGVLFSYTVHHHPPLPGFQMPHPVGVADMDEGVRLVAGLDGVALDSIVIGMRLETEFVRRGDFASYRFRVPSPAKASV
jgi:3-oxo-4,17-pregnadiene-20-carboxyl-CoA hydratase alpha subunit